MLLFVTKLPIVIKLLFVTNLHLISTFFMLQSFAVIQKKNIVAKLAQLKSLFKFVSLLTQLLTIMIHSEIITFEVQHRYYVSFFINGKQYSKRINFNEYQEINQDNFININYHK